MAANEFTDVWPKIIPGVAIALQVSLDNMLNLQFNRTDSEILQCGGENESAWRTAAFVVSFVIGFAVMKRFNDNRLFHEIVNVGLITGWLFSISDFPLTCWISATEPLSELQTRNVKITRLFIGVVGNNLWALLETSQPAFLLNFINSINMLVLQCMGGHPNGHGGDQPNGHGGNLHIVDAGGQHNPVEGEPQNHIEDEEQA